MKKEIEDVIQGIELGIVLLRFEGENARREALGKRPAVGKQSTITHDHNSSPATAEANPA